MPVISSQSAIASFNVGSATMIQPKPALTVEPVRENVGLKTDVSRRSLAAAMMLSAGVIGSL
jgi:hypothetical protein